MAIPAVLRATWSGVNADLEGRWHRPWAAGGQSGAQHNVRRFLPASLLCCALASAVSLGCRSSVAAHSQDNDNPEVARVGQVFKLRAGRQTALAGEAITIKFSSVGADSRCPAEVQCAWAGNAEVLLEIGDDGKVASLKLNTHGGPQYVKEGRYRVYGVELIGLSPHPRRDKKIGASEYVAALKISKQ